mmetsp:Transcript_6216/g.18662  ORF Transcript_6216/g.18662 Transcript_6216/m.18662 type:complete len:390 (+) Transcript_6216:98-1267(+)
MPRPTVARQQPDSADDGAGQSAEAVAEAVRLVGGESEGEDDGSYDGESRADSDEEPLDYLMLEFASRLPEQEAARLLQRVRRHERRHERAAEELRKHRQQRHDSGGSRAQDGPGCPGPVAQDTAQCPAAVARATASQADAAAGGQLEAGADGAAAQQGGRAAPSQRWMSCAIAVAIAAALSVPLTTGWLHGSPAEHASGVPSGGQGRPAAVQPQVEVSSAASEAEARALARARELAAEENVRQEMRRALEAAAERLAAHQAPEPAQRLAALRDHVQELEQEGYQVLLRPPEEGSSLQMPREDPEAMRRVAGLEALLREADFPAERLRSAALRLAAQGVDAEALRGAAPEDLATALSAPELVLSAGQRLQALAGLRRYAARAAQRTATAP